MKRRKYAFRAMLSALFALIALFSFVTAFLAVNADKSSVFLNRPVVVKSGWYVVEDGKKIYINIDEPQVVKDGHFVVFNNIIFEKYGGQTLSTRSAEYGLQVKLNDTVIYEYADQGFKRNKQMKESLFCDVQIPQINEIHQINGEGDTYLYRYGAPIISLEYNDIDGDFVTVPEITVGSARDTFVAHCMSEIIPLSVILIFIFMAAVLFCTAAIMKYLGICEYRLVNMAFFMLICSFWEITNSPVLQQLFAMPAAAHHISFCMFMLMGVPVCSFILNTQGMKRYRSIFVCKILFYINLAVQNIVYCALGIDLSDMLLITHVLIAAGIIIISVSLLREWRRSEFTEIKMIFTAFVMLGACGIAALALYWVIESSYGYYSSVFWTGMILFVMFLLYCVIVSMIRSMQFRSEALICKKIAGIDLMTGLGNNLSFERKVEEIEKTADEFSNIVIMFINIRGMKKLNDTAGYKKGDEIIIAVANSVKKLFGKKGECYRTFGDEFCVIMTNTAPEESEELWAQQLTAEESRITKNGLYEISLRWGSSFIRDENGKMKTVSDWKYEADQKMRMMC